MHDELTSLASAVCQDHKAVRQCSQVSGGCCFITHLCVHRTACCRCRHGVAADINMQYCILQDFKLQNIVGSCDVKFPIRLEGLAYAHTHFSSVSLHTVIQLMPTASFGAMSDCALAPQLINMVISLSDCTFLLVMPEPHIPIKHKIVYKVFHHWYGECCTVPAV